MKIFKIQVLFDEEHQLKKDFSLDIIFCNQRRELDGYWLFDYSDNTLPEILLFFLEGWKKAILSLRKGEKVFLSIGLWDEGVEGFYITQLDNRSKIKIEYGFVADWGSVNRESPHDNNIKEDMYHKNFETESIKEDFLQDIAENITYLEKQRRRIINIS